MTVFLRVLEGSVEAKPADLLCAITALREIGDQMAAIHRKVFELDTTLFSKVPGSPFAYWVSDRFRDIFSRFPPFEADGRVARKGLTTSNDDRYVRLWWEPTTGNLVRNWSTYAKGGSAQVFWGSLHTVLRWDPAQRTIPGYCGRAGRESSKVECADLMGAPGLTWPLRAAVFSPSILPSGSVFSARGYTIQAAHKDLPWLLALTASRAFDALFKVCLGRSGHPEFIVGVLQRLPLPIPETTVRNELAALAIRAWSLNRSLDTTREGSHAFFLPPGLGESRTSPGREAVVQELAAIQSDIDNIIFRLYGILEEDRLQIEAWSGKSTLAAVEEDPLAADDEDDSDTEDPDAADDTLDLVSWSVGVALGRFDLRLATGERRAPAEPEPFDPLPALSPGMLPEGDPPFRQDTGILVDDPGHRDDLTAAATSVLNAVKVEPPADLHRTLARDFFPFHIQRYSKSRRKAPIYWQLATSSASYSVWLYLHAFSDDTLYKVQNDYAGPKLRHEEQKLDGLRREYGENPTASQRKEVDSQETFVAELRTFLDEVKRVAPLWKPDLDDGVIINFAPLWRLVPHHRPWQKECKTAWDALADGDYDWSHLAMHLWPERVVPKCKQDRSLAIAHGLEDVFWSEDADGKWKPRPTPTRPLTDLVKERTSPAVKAALDSLLSAPHPGGASRSRGKGKRMATGGES